MSVIFREKPKPIGEAEIQRMIDERIAEMGGAADGAARLLRASFPALIVADRASGAGAITDDMILQSSALVEYPAWAAGQSYRAGDIVEAGGLLFEVMKAHEALDAYPVETTFALYRLVELVHAGTLADPIPYPETPGVVVAVEAGRYYTYKGSVYRAAVDMPDCVWTPDTAGMWQWERVKEG